MRRLPSKIGKLSRLRSAIYTRKSTEDGLEQDFNSLHAQRAACEAYIMSQKSEGWVLLPDAYDDGAFSPSLANPQPLTRADLRAFWPPSEI
nr:recombinase family protein [Govania unica]